MKNRQRDFVAYVLSLIEDATLHPVVQAFFDAVPEPFWTAPASSSGRFHPDYALGEGGLVRHTLVALTVGLDLARIYGMTSPQETDAIVIALACHDAYKGGESNEWTTTVPVHPALAASYLWEHGANQTLAWAGMAIETHMSMWTNGAALAVGHDLNAMQSLVATADYVASRKYLVPDDDLAQLLLLF
jgi:hypothetical protein